MKNEKIEKKSIFLQEILLFLAKSVLYMILAFFWGTKHFCSSKFEKFDKNSYYIPQKKAKNMYNSDSGRKSVICYKKNGRKIIFNFFSKGGPFDVGTIKKIFCDFSNFQKFSWKVASMGPKNV